MKNLLLHEYESLVLDLDTKILNSDSDFIYDIKDNILLQSLYKKINKYIKKEPIFPVIIGNELHKISYRARVAFTESPNIKIEETDLLEAFIKDKTTFWNQHNFKHRPMLWGVNLIIYNENLQIFTGKRENRTAQGREGIYLGHIGLTGGKADLKDFEEQKSLKYALLKGLLRELHEETKLKLTLEQLKTAKYKTFINTKRLKPELFVLVQVQNNLQGYEETKELKDLKFRTISKIDYSKYTHDLIFAKELVLDTVSFN